MASEGPNLGQIPIPEPTNCVLRSKKNLTALLAILRLELGKDHAPDEEHVRREMKQQTPLPWAGFSAPGCCSTESLSDPRKAQTLAGPIADRGCALPVAASCLSAFACSTKPLQSLRSRGRCLLFFFCLVPQYLIYTSVPTHLLAYVLTGLPTDLRTPRGWSLWRPAVGLAHST